MASPQLSRSPLSEHETHKLACTLCARRKVRCNKADPCLNCSKAQVTCIYPDPTPRRPRKRPAAEEDVLSRLKRYEDLMRKHNVDFDRHDNVWIPSGLEAKLEETVVFFGKPESPTTQANNSLPEKTPSCAVELVEVILWSSLAPELRNPPMQCPASEESLPCPHVSKISDVVSLWPTMDIIKSNPEPRHIFKLWQLFVEKINPLTKVIHVPTLQQRILEVSWNLDAASKPTLCLLFAIYTMVISTLTGNECEQYFGEDRDTLLTRYRTTAIQALVAADIFTTKDLDVLQAFTLFLLADPQSDLTTTLAVVAMRVGQKMSLHRAEFDSTLSFFEAEMRIRLWWQIRGLDSRARLAVAGSHSTKLSKLPPELENVRLPLNVNDSDLHPDMVEPPMEHAGPTEMLYVLMKYEVMRWLRLSPIAIRVLQPPSELVQEGHSPENIITMKDQAIDELEAIHHAKHRGCDAKIPLHALSMAMGSLAMSRIRFKVHHPRNKPDGGTHMTVQENSQLFENALRMIELARQSRNSRFATPLLNHMTSLSQMDAWVWVISELRRRYTGSRVAEAWQLVESLFTRNPDMLGDGGDHDFFTAFGDLTLEAWEPRRHELIRGGAREIDVTPRFIKLLRASRGKGDDNYFAIPTADPPGGLTLLDDNILNWEYWDDFLRM